jgi:hypothetical protein
MILSLDRVRHETSRATHINLPWLDIDNDACHLEVDWLPRGISHSWYPLIQDFLTEIMWGNLDETTVWAIGESIK